MASPDPDLEALLRWAKPMEDRFYIVNRLVSSRDISRILGPYTKAQLDDKRAQFLSVTGSIPPEKGRPLFIVYQYSNGAYERIE